MGFCRKLLLRPGLSLAVILAAVVLIVRVAPQPPFATIATAALADGGDDGGDDGGNGSGDGGDGGSGDDGSDGGDLGEAAASGESESGGNDEGGDDEGASEAEDEAGSESGPAPEAGGADGGHEENEVLGADLSPDSLAQAIGLGFSIRGEEQLANLGLTLTRLSPPPGEEAVAARSELARRVGGLYDLNHVYRLAGADTVAGTVAAPGGDCDGPWCGPRALIGWPAVGPRCGQGIRIGMVDTGIDPQAESMISVGRSDGLRDRSFLDPGQSPSSPGHGTAIAGLLAGDPAAGFPGLLPGATLYSAAAFYADAQGRPMTNAVAILRALDWLAGERVGVVNVSVTGPPNVLLRRAVRALRKRGVLVVAAAGNGGPGAPPAYPAAYAGAVAVTAVDLQARPYRRANRGAYVAVAAPGVNIWTPGVSGGQYRSGTSFAAPFVTAVLADLQRAGGGDSEQALAALFAQLRDLGAPGYDTVFGYGLLQGSPHCQ